MDIFEIYLEESGEEFPIHIIEYEDYVLFKANDIGDILNLSYITKQISSFDDSERKTVIIKNQAFFFLTDIGAYTVLGSSRKKNSKNLLKWINRYAKNFDKKKELRNKKIEDIPIVTRYDDVYVAYIFKFENNDKKVNYFVKVTKNWFKKSRFLESVFPNGQLIFTISFDKNKVDYKKYIDYVKYTLCNYTSSDIYDNDLDLEYTKRVLALPLIYSRFSDTKNEEETIKLTKDSDLLEIRNDLLPSS